MAIDSKYKQGKYIQFKLNNVEVWWAKVHKPDTAFGNNRWSIDMHLTDALSAQMKAEGFNVTDKESGGVVTKNILRAKKDAVTKDGKPQKAPEVVGPDGRTPFTDDIGNGSICNLILSARAWEINKKWVLTTYLEKVQVVKHVAYAGSSFEDVSGELAF